MSDERADPDSLLRDIERNETERERGRLKIFLGMAAGVGKTYAMLSEARSRREEGLDIVAAYAETHGRADTEEMLAGIENIPVQEIEYRNTALIEPDYEAIRDRRPAVVIIDELPHTNAPGSRRLKRWMDVLDLLEDGISVWTALNVQHIESIADVVEDLTYAPIRERVPDSVLDRANEIRLIDLAPEELIERLSSGKIYRGGQSREAMDRFFKPRNLAALRELSLRWSAQNAAARAAGYGNVDAARYAKSGARLLVAVGSAPSSEYLVRWTRRAAFSQRAEWIAVHVESGGDLPPVDAARLERNLDLARKLGAETAILPAADIVAAVVDYAHSRGVTQIVVGKSGLSSTRLFRRSATIAERFMRESLDIDCVAVQERGGVPILPASLRLRRALRGLTAASPGRYGIGALIFVLLTAFNFFVADAGGYRAAAIVYLAGVALASLALPLGPVFLLAAASALAWNYLFIPPIYTFAIGNPDDTLTLALYFVLALVTGTLTTRKRANERSLAERERRMRVLYDLAQRLAAARGADECAEAGLVSVEKALEGTAVIVARDEADGSEPVPIGNGAADVDDREAAAARYAYESGSVCGRGSDSLPESRFRWLPLVAGGTSVGALGVALGADVPWTSSSKDLAAALAFTVAGALERERLADRRRKSLLEMESERLARTLLSSVSHEIRTPLAAVIGAATALADKTTAEDATARTALLSEVLSAAGRLDLVVGNLLSMTRIESGALRLKLETVDPADILSAATDDARAAERANDADDRPVRIDAAGAVRLVRVDEALLVQALSNLIRNARRYSPPGLPIELRAEEVGRALTLTVRDHGPGIPEAELTRLFEKFFRGEAARGGGIGLGLSICKGIAEAHGGEVEAVLPDDGGLEMRIRIPDCVEEAHDAPNAHH
jgi:two-component system sensor histidine kinase KdpD